MYVCTCAVVSLTCNAKKLRSTRIAAVLLTLLNRYPEILQIVCVCMCVCVCVCVYVCVRVCEGCHPT